MRWYRPRLRCAPIATQRPALRRAWHPSAWPPASSDNAHPNGADRAPMNYTPETVAGAPADDTAEALKQRFPAAFAGAPRPLKLRIQADIQARAPGVFSKAALGAFLRRHTGRHGYLLALARGGPRFDLDGQPAGEISAEHAQAAAAELARRREQRGQRERELDDQRRERAALLRAYEASRVSRANFCALKGIPEAALDALLDLARREAADRAAVRHDRPANQRPAHGRPAQGRPTHERRPPMRAR